MGADYLLYGIVDTVVDTYFPISRQFSFLASISGPPGLRLIKGFHDEALLGERQGYRSSRFGLQWRVIYRFVPEELLFQN